MGCRSAGQSGLVGAALVSRLSPARRAALNALLEAERSGSFVRDVLERADARPSDARDAAFALRLALGVTATRGCVDELLDRFLAKPNRVKLPVRMALRVAAFELVYLDAMPEVAVSQGVELVRAHAASAAGMANAVLRRVAEARVGYLAAEDALAEARAAFSRARRAGLPLWLVEQIVAARGEAAAEQLTAAELEPAPVSFHLNPRNAPADTSAGAGEELVPLPGCFTPGNASAFIATRALARGEAVASDTTAQLIATTCVAAGSCLEIGAGRGTKTYVMAAQSERAGMARTHVAAELSPRKVELNRKRLEESGLARGVSFATGDCRHLDQVLTACDAAAGERVRYDTVFLDAPCSGTGTMRRHPEIPWRLEPADVAPGGALPALQLALLTEASRRVAVGGQLVYATCSVLAEENERVVDAFLASEEGRDFELAPLSEAPIFRETLFRETGAYLHEAANERGMLQTIPALGRPDGHFAARLVRRS